MEQLLVAYDDSPPARAALAWAIDDARRLGRAIVLLYVVSVVAEWELAAIQVDTDAIREQFKTLLRTTWSEPLRKAGIEHHTRLAVARPADGILDVAREEENVVAIVMGMSGRGLLHEIVGGTATRLVMHQARRPVVAVPAGWAPPEDRESQSPRPR
jgi:nucleotide-binding universal stress UspA family protein